MGAVAGLALLAGCAGETSTPSAKELSKYLPNEKQLGDAGAEQRQAPASFAAEWINPLLLVPQCEGERPWESAFRTDAQATARTGDLLVWQLVAAYDGYSGEQVLSTVDKALNCGDTAAHDPLPAGSPQFSVSAVADPQIGFCRRFRAAGMSSCAMVFARGDRVLAIRTDSTTADAAAQQAELERLAPTFVAAFDQD
ncbi:hypothetical protein [Amycolatopsis sp. NPDC003676]